MSRPSYDGVGFTVEALAQACGFSRQAYYQARCRADRRAEHEAQAIERVEQVRQRHPRMGTRKLYQEHYDTFRACSIGRDALFELLWREGLLIEPKRRGTRTTNSRHGFRTWENLLTEGYTAKRANEVFVADITYLATAEDFCYLALITDAFSRKIVGWDLSKSLSVEGSLRALDRALAQTSRAERKRLIHHSDRGVQYCCHAYIERLEKAGARVSMAAVGNPYENALAERVNGILEQEYRLDAYFGSEAQARRAVQEAVYLYNEERPHRSLAYRKPSQVHAETRLAA